MIVSPTTKSMPLLEINFISAAASNISAVAPDVPPVISSSFANGPFVDGLSNDKDVLSARVIARPLGSVLNVMLVCDVTS